MKGPNGVFIFFFGFSYIRNFFFHLIDFVGFCFYWITSEIRESNLYFEIKNSKS